MTDRFETMRPVLEGLLGTGFSSGAAAATRLLEGLRAELRGRREAFHEAIVGLLDDAGTDNERPRMLQTRDLLSPRRAARLVEPADSSASSSTG